MCFTVNVNIVREELERKFGTRFIDPRDYKPSYYYHAHSLPELPVAGYFNNEFSIRLLNNKSVNRNTHALIEKYTYPAPTDLF